MDQVNKMSELDEKGKKLKTQLEQIWSICPENGKGHEFDQFIDGFEADIGATRLVESGEQTPSDSGVRIRFISKK